MCELTEVSKDGCYVEYPGMISCVEAIESNSCPIFYGENPRHHRCMEVCEKIMGNKRIKEVATC